MRIEVKDESEEMREMEMRRRGGSRRKKCKGKNNVSEERDKKIGEEKEEWERREMSENIYEGRGNSENEENKTKPKS